jgi:hypothetical protein
VVRVFVCFLVVLAAVVYFGQKLLDESDGCTEAPNGACVEGNTSVGYP